MKIKDIIKQLIMLAGDDPNREGLVDTPLRVVRAYGELFSGYAKEPKDVMKVFDSNGYDQIVICKDIEFYSMCEHHMLPFAGKAHIAYIPGDKIIGLSKLARLLDIYARRLQIQERIADQVTAALMEHLQPQGAACVIEAEHFCMRMRGVSKQNSTMVTSSMKGVFMDKPAARAELMALIKGV